MNAQFSNAHLKKKRKRLVDKKLLKEYAEKHRFCEICGSNQDFGCPAGGVHHKVFRSQGGSDVEDNLIRLCAVHHALAHNGGLSAEDLDRYQYGEEND